MATERVQRRIDRLLDEAERAMDARDWEVAGSLAREALDLDPENVDALTFIAAMERKGGSRAPHPEGEGEGQPELQHHPEQPLAGAGGSPALPGPAVPHPVGARFIAPAAQTPLVPTSFANGRYTVKRFLGEGGKKKVYLAHDTLLDRDVAFALIKTEGLDDAGRDRITREAQAMGRLGAHPHIVSVFDLGEEPATSNGNEQRAPHPDPLPKWERAAVRANRAAEPAPRHGQPYIVTELMGGGDVEGLIEKAPEHRPPLGADARRSASQVCEGLEFAHGHGIVHRDLKPGNVWLTAANRQLATGNRGWRGRLPPCCLLPRRSPSSATSASPSPSTARASRRPA